MPVYSGGMETANRGNGWTVPVIVAVAFALPLLAPGTPPAGLQERFAAGAVQSCSQFLFLIAIIVASGRSRQFGPWAPRPRDVPAAAILFVVLALAGMAAAAASRALGWSVPVVAVPNGPPSARLVATALAFAFGVGYREELFYRVYLTGELTGRGVAAPAAAAASTLLFAAFHIHQGPAGMLSAALAGAILSAALARGVGLHGLAWAHAAYDLAVIAGTYGHVR